MNNIQASPLPLSTPQKFSQVGAPNFRASQMLLKKASSVKYIKLSLPESVSSVKTALFASGAFVASLFGIETKKESELDSVYARIAAAFVTQEQIAGMAKKIPGLYDFAGVKTKEFKKSIEDAQVLSMYSKKELRTLLSDNLNRELVLRKLQDIEGINLEFIKFVAHKNNTNFQSFAEHIDNMQVKKMSRRDVQGVFDSIFQERVVKIKAQKLEEEKQAVLSRLDNVDKDALEQRKTEYQNMKAMKRCELYQQIVPKIDWLADKNVANLLKKMLFEEHSISLVEVDEILKSYNVKPPEKTASHSENMHYAFFNMIEDKDAAAYLKMCAMSGQNVVDIEEIENYKKGKNLRETFMKLFSSFDFSKKINNKAE